MSVGEFDALRKAATHRHRNAVVTTPDPAPCT